MLEEEKDEESAPLLESNNQKANECYKGFANCVKLMSPIDWLFFVLFIAIIGITLIVIMHN